MRFNQDNPPYDDVAVRRALQMAVSNAVVLELGYNGLGSVAENHHVCPIHPEYAELPPPVADPDAALAAIEAAALDVPTEAPADAVEPPVASIPAELTQRLEDFDQRLAAIEAELAATQEIVEEQA